MVLAKRSLKGYYLLAPPVLSHQSMNFQQFIHRCESTHDLTVKQHNKNTKIKIKIKIKLLPLILTLFVGAKVC